MGAAIFIIYATAISMLIAYPYAKKPVEDKPKSSLIITKPKVNALQMYEKNAESIMTEPSRISIEVNR